MQKLIKHLNVESISLGVVSLVNSYGISNLVFASRLATGGFGTAYFKLLLSFIKYIHDFNIISTNPFEIK